MAKQTAFRFPTAQCECLNDTKRINSHMIRNYSSEDQDMGENTLIVTL
jgi:hypothetical protein